MWEELAGHTECRELYSSQLVLPHFLPVDNHDHRIVDPDAGEMVIL